MKLGKAEPNIFDRSIYKQLHNTRPEIKSGKPRFGTDFAVISNLKDMDQAVATASVSFSTDEAGYLASNYAINNLVVSGAEPVGMMVNITMPVKLREIKLKAIMSQIEEVCEAFHMQIAGGHTETSDAVIRPVVSCTAIGYIDSHTDFKSSNMVSDLDIVMTKSIGMAGTALLATTHRTELASRLPEYLIEEAAGFREKVSVALEASVAAAYSGTVAMHDVASGGIFAAVWELCEASGCGVKLDLKAIPVRQETIEISEFFGINPYELMGQGALLIATRDGMGLIDRLGEAGVASAIIGKSTSSNDRIVVNGDETRFLERPVSDAFYEITC